MSVVVIGLSHRSAPVELRERFAFGEARIPAVLAALGKTDLFRTHEVSRIKAVLETMKMF